VPPRKQRHESNSVRYKVSYRLEHEVRCIGHWLDVGVGDGGEGVKVELEVVFDVDVSALVALGVAVVGRREHGDELSVVLL
jgi:hypothetical protein